MKTNLAFVSRATRVSTTLFFFPALVFATIDDAPDHAQQLLAARGSLPVKAAGPYVEIGTFQVQVAAKLGQPAAKLADGAWLYSNFNVSGSEATGTLVVNFENGRVSQLALVAPTLAAARSPSQKAKGADPRVTSSK